MDKVHIIGGAAFVVGILWMCVFDSVCHWIPICAGIVTAMVVINIAKTK